MHRAFPGPASAQGRPARASRRAHLAQLGAWLVTLGSTGTGLVACGGGSAATGSSSAESASLRTSTDATVSPSTTPLTPGAADPVSPDAAPTTPPHLTVLSEALSRPWSLAFLPDGRLLVSQLGGSFVLVSADGGAISGPIDGLPPVYLAGQGGLMDVVLDPDFDLSTYPWIYWVYAAGSDQGSTTVVARGRLQLTDPGVTAGVSPGSLTQVQEIFRQSPTLLSAKQYGARLAFRADKTLFITLGDRGQDDPGAPTGLYAQNPASSIGKVLRIHRDGSIPVDNPVIANGVPGLWSLGHRNPQGAAVHPVSGDLWVTEHGPQGGDELNHVHPGGNYGWPVRSYGCPYTITYSETVSPESCRVGGGTHAPDYVEPVSVWWSKSLAPSGLAFCTSPKFPEWQHNVLMGAMQTYTGYEARRGLWRLVLDGDTLVSRERLDLIGDERVRDVRQGPDGWIYVLTDSGKLLRIDR